LEKGIEVKAEFIKEFMDDTAGFLTRGLGGAGSGGGILGGLLGKLFGRRA
jgi:hypothetical protein